MVQLASPIQRQLPVRVTAEWLLENRAEVAILDTRSSERYQSGHLEGSHSFALDKFVINDSSEAALLRLAGQVQERLSELGIGPNQRIVMVDDHDGTASMGALLLELAGAVNIATMRGGIESWQGLRDARLVTDVTAPAESLGRDLWRDADINLDGLATFEQLEKAALNHPHSILDVRSQLEHEGVIGAHCCSAHGSIDGSSHLEWTALLTITNLAHSPDRIREILARVGFSTDDNLIVICHAGHRAAVAGRVLRASGFTNVRVSLGSWHEWAHTTLSKRS